MHTWLLKILRRYALVKICQSFKLQTFLNICLCSVLKNTRALQILQASDSVIIILFLEEN